MSYDLFFRTRTGHPPLTAEAFQAWFQERPHYTVSGGEAVYANESTGVSFTFNFASEDELEGVEGDEGAEDSDEPVPDLHAAFNLNYLRPRFFALEAEPELAAFVEHFELEVEDPQTNGMGSGPYSREAFLRGWNTGNAFAARAILQQEGNAPNERPPTLPAEQLERLWRWNHARAGLQKELGEGVFVPRISLALEQGRLVTYAVWGDAIPIALPQVERVVLVRDELARGWLFKRKETALVDAATVARWVEAFPMKEGALPYRLMAYTKPSAELVRAFKEAPALAGQVRMVTFDAVLDAELVASLKAG